MPLADLGSLAQDARSAGRGLGAFNVIHLEHAETFVAAAERAGLPVVLQISQNAVKYHGSLAPIAAGTLAAARATRSEEHTSELQSRGHLVCRLLLEKKNGCARSSPARRCNDRVVE